MIDGSNFKRLTQTNEKNKAWRMLCHNKVIKDYSSKGKVNNNERGTASKSSTSYNKDNKASLVIVTCPVARQNTSPYLYMSWLDVLSRDIDAPVLMLRGNQENAITFYMS